MFTVMHDFDDLRPAYVCLIGRKNPRSSMPAA